MAHATEFARCPAPPARPRRLTPTERAAITALSPAHRHAIITIPDSVRAVKNWFGSAVAAKARPRHFAQAAPPLFARGENQALALSLVAANPPIRRRVEKAAAVLELYATADACAAAGAPDGATPTRSPQSKRANASPQTLPAQPGLPVRVADRYRRRGGLQLFCALAVASGLTFARTFTRKCFAPLQRVSAGLVYQSPVRRDQGLESDS